MFLTTALLSTPVRAEEKTFDSNGVRINYLDQGEGEAVVLLHGFGGSAAEMWVTFAYADTPMLLLPELVKEWRVIAPDLRGHGKSDKPRDARMYGGEVAEDVVRLLDHLKIKQAHVVGYSMGASVAGKLLVSHPDRLLSVTFGGGGPSFRPAKAFATVVDATAESLESGEGIGPLVIALASEGQPKFTPEQAAEIGKRAVADKDQKVLAAVLRGIKGLEVTEDQLKANRVPVQFVYGSREADFLREGIEASRKELPTAKVTVVENGDHVSTVVSPEFRAAVLEFLRKHPGGGPG